jgi:hypothetical protein
MVKQAKLFPILALLFVSMPHINKSGVDRNYNSVIIEPIRTV